MYNEQVKTTLSESLIVVDTEITMKKKYILENILSYLFKDDIEKYKVSVSLTNVLYITDGYDTEPLTVDFNGSKLHIDTKSFLRYTKETFDEKEFKDLYYNKSIIIIGCINRMDPKIVNGIVSLFTSHLIVLYGDTSLSYQDEFKSFYSNLFTNTKLDISENYTPEIFDINKKKIYNVVSKIRKGVEPNKLSISSIFNLIESNKIDIRDIETFIENEDNVVVVPDVYYNSINSSLYYSKNGKTDLTPSMTTEFYNIYPIILKDVKGNWDIIPPFSKLLVPSDPMGEPYFMDNGIYIDISISYNNKIYYSVPFDFGFYINNFSQDEHPEHEDEYNIINNVEKHFKGSVLNYTTIKAIPFKVLRSLYVKQEKFKNIRVYDLLIPPVSYQSLVNNNLYSSICTASDSIEIVSSINFEIE